MGSQSLVREHQRHVSFELKGEVRQEASCQCKIKPTPYITEVKEKED